MEDLVTEFQTQLGLIVPQVALIFGAIIGLVALVALGRFVISRVRGSIK